MIILSDRIVVQSVSLSSPQAQQIGRLDSVEWNGGMEWWNGTVEWNSGMTTPIEGLLHNDLYPVSDKELVRSRHMESVVLRSWKVSECQDGGYIAQDD